MRDRGTKPQTNSNMHSARELISAGRQEDERLRERDDVPEKPHPLKDARFRQS